MERNRTPGVLTWVALLTTMILWAAAFVGIRYATAYFSPGPLALGRLATAAVILLGVLAIRRQTHIPRPAWPGLLIAGLFWFGLYMVALNWGETMVDSATAALVVGIGPLLVVVISAVYLRERPKIPLYVGLGVAMAGTILAAAGQERAGGSMLGIILCVIAAVGFAIGSTAQKPSLAFASPLQATAIGCGVGTVVCLPFVPGLFAEAQSAPLPALIVVVLLGALPTALAFFTWAYAMKRAPAGVLATSTYLVPGFTLVIAWLTLGEVPAVWSLIGGIISLGGVAIATFGSSIRWRNRTRDRHRH